MELPSEGSKDIASDIRLCKWTEREVRLFLKRHGADYLWDDFKSPLIRRNVAEISFPITWEQKIEQREIEEQARYRLDLPKWSLLLTKDQDIPVSEGTCLLTARLDRRGGRFRRDENIICGNYTLDLADIQRCRDLVLQFHSAIAALQKPADLKQALWHFGRACVASLPQDVLVESVMGLEAILVQGSGESRYRFSLNGAVILSDTVTISGESLHKDLKKIYDLRSQAVHGERITEVENFAPKSRKLLAKAISAIVEFIIQDVLNTKEGIAEVVQKYVFQKVIPNF